MIATLGVAFLVFKQFLAAHFHIIYIFNNPQMQTAKKTPFLLPTPTFKKAIKNCNFVIYGGIC